MGNEARAEARVYMESSRPFKFGADGPWEAGTAEIEFVYELYLAGAARVEVILDKSLPDTMEGTVPYKLPAVDQVLRKIHELNTIEVPREYGDPSLLGKIVYRLWWD